jgi:hypothetical protein
MMVQDEQENQTEERSGAIIDGDAKQEAEPGAAKRDSPASRQKALGGSVYFIRSADGAFMKIGFTRLDVAVRFRQICSGLPGLHLVGYLPGTRHTEVWIHGKFHLLQENGEWFRCEPDLLAFMAAIGLIVPELVVVRPGRPITRNRLCSSKNSAAVALGKLAASRRTREQLAEAGRQGGLAKAANRANGTAAALETETELAESTSQKQTKKL